jgi:hypothetical protein
MTEIGYYYPPTPPETEWDTHYNGFEMWLDDNYDVETGRVFGRLWDEAVESDDLLREYIEWVEDHV